MTQATAPQDFLKSVRTLHDTGEPGTMAYAVGLWDDEWRILCRWNGEEGSPGFPQSRGRGVWMVLNHRPGIAALATVLDDSDIETLVYALGEKRL